MLNLLYKPTFDMLRSPAMLLPHESTVSHEHHLENQDIRRGMALKKHSEEGRVGLFIFVFCCTCQVFRLPMVRSHHIHMIWTMMILTPWRRLKQAPTRATDRGRKQQGTKHFDCILLVLVIFAQAIVLYCLSCSILLSHCS